MSASFIDTNILLRHLLQDHSDYSPKASNLIYKIEQDNLQVFLSEMVVAEVVFTLQRTYQVPKAQIVQALLPIINLAGIKMLGKRKFKAIFGLYLNLNIPFPDAYLMVQMKQRKSHKIYSFDEDFDKIPDITRLEPS